jgi:large subunit ribosomal protein L11
VTDGKESDRIPEIAGAGRCGEPFAPDRSFTFEMKTPPMSFFLKQAAKIQSGSKAPGRDKAGAVTKAQVREIAEKKMKDLNCDSIESAMKMVEGSARSMGLEVAG